MYTADEEIASFFQKTTATRSACDAYAEKLGGKAIPVKVQGICSYTVYSGPNAEFVAQFRLKSLRLNMKIMNLAQAIYGELAPQVTFMGEMGEDIEGKGEPLYIYFMNRIQGVSRLDFILNHDVDDESPEASYWRKNLTTDVARFFAKSWMAPQDVDQTYRDNLYRQYEKDLRLLLISLPARFHPLIQKSLDSLPTIFSLPMVLSHQDFSVFNIIVDGTSGRLVGVVDWAEAEIVPFGLNLHFYESLIMTVDLEAGWSRHDDYIGLEKRFWLTFRLEVVGGLGSIKTDQIIKKARIAGLLLTRGFTPRLADMPEPVPIQDDTKKGKLSMDALDALLINPATRFTDLA